MLHAIVFDFDGVLADSEPLHFEVFRQVLAEIGITLTPEAYYEKYLGYDDLARSTRCCATKAVRTTRR